MAGAKLGCHILAANASSLTCVLVGIRRKKACCASEFTGGSVLLGWLPAREVLVSGDV